MHFRVTEDAAFKQLERCIDIDRDIAALFQNGKRAGCQPAATMGGSESLLAMAMAIGRIGKQKIERLDIVDAAELGRVTPQDAGAPVQPQRIDILPQKPLPSTPFSTKSATRQPRDKASRPTAPVPAKTSRTRVPSRLSG